MMLADTNILIYAHRLDADRHHEYRDWLQSVTNGPAAYAVSDFALTGMIRIVTDRRIYPEPSPLDRALAFAEEVRNQQQARVISPGPQFWPIFTEICRTVGAMGKLIPDAYLAALAIEHGCELVSEDRGFRKFPRLRWRRPLD